MASTGMVKLAAVFEMLSVCAPGHSVEEKTHHWRVTFGDKVFPTLTKGPHGRGANVAIQVGVVKKMARTLGILECAKKQLEQLR